MQEKVPNQFKGERNWGEPSEFITHVYTLALKLLDLYRSMNSKRTAYPDPEFYYN